MFFILTPQRPDATQKFPRLALLRRRWHAGADLLDQCAHLAREEVDRRREIAAIRIAGSEAFAVCAFNATPLPAVHFGFRIVFHD